MLLKNKGVFYLKYSEEKLERYASPIGKTEEDKCKNAIRMVRDALKIVGYSDNGKEIRAIEKDAYAFALDMSQSGRNITLLTQGSYANKTNIPKQSDVDVAVILESTFTSTYRSGITRDNYGFTPGTYSASELKDEVEKALKGYYKIGVERHNKSIKVYGNTYRVDADVVPAYRHRNYSRDFSFDTNNYEKGIEIIPDKGAAIINYPELHIQMGIAKNKVTDYRFKKVVRIIKNIKEDMIEGGVKVPDEISSFGIESLLWNVDVSVYKKYGILRFMVDEVISYLNQNIDGLTDYLEVNGIKKLFPDKQKLDAYKTFVLQLSSFYQYDI